MKKTKEIFEIEIIKANEEQGIYYKTTSKKLYSLKLDKVVANNVFDFHFIKSGIVYTQSEVGDLFIKKEESEIDVQPGFFYLAFFRKVKDCYVISVKESIIDLTNKAILLDESFKVSKPFKTFRAYINGYFVTSFKGEIVVFDSELNEKWRKSISEIDNTLSNDEKFKRNFFEVGKDIIVLPSNSGKFLAIDIISGNLIWRRDELGRLSIFENKIYCIANYTLKELEAKTGKVLKEESMNPLIEAYNFRPTGEHKVYGDYIFSMSSGKPGMIAVFERESLKFIELIKFVEMIPVGLDNLIWHEGKLFVLDASKTLHIFEKE